MIPPLIRASLAALAMASTLPFAYAQAPLCPVPSPYNDSLLPPLSPRPTTNQDNILLWVAGPGFYELEGATVDRQGSTIFVTTREVYTDFFPGESGRCRTVSLGILPAGIYTIIRGRYIRDRDQPNYPANLSTGPTALPTFTVSATSTVPSLGLTGYLTLAALLSALAALVLRHGKQA